MNPVLDQQLYELSLIPSNLTRLSIVAPEWANKLGARLIPGTVVHFNRFIHNPSVSPVRSFWVVLMTKFYSELEDLEAAKTFWRAVDVRALSINLFGTMGTGIRRYLAATNTILNRLYVGGDRDTADQIIGTLFTSEIIVRYVEELNRDMRDSCITSISSEFVPMKGDIEGHAIFWLMVFVKRCFQIASRPSIKNQMLIYYCLIIEHLDAALYGQSMEIKKRDIRAITTRVSTLRWMDNINPAFSETYNISRILRQLDFKRIALSFNLNKNQQSLKKLLEFIRLYFDSHRLKDKWNQFISTIDFDFNRIIQFKSTPFYINMLFRVFLDFGMQSKICALLAEQGVLGQYKAFAEQDNVLWLKRFFESCPSEAFHSTAQSLKPEPIKFKAIDIEDIIANKHNYVSITGDVYSVGIFDDKKILFLSLGKDPKSTFQCVIFFADLSTIGWCSPLDSCQYLYNNITVTGYIRISARNRPQIIVRLSDQLNVNHPLYPIPIDADAELRSCETEYILVNGEIATIFCELEGKNTMLFLTTAANSTVECIIFGGYASNFSFFEDMGDATFNRPVNIKGICRIYEGNIQLSLFSRDQILFL
jgi:hypothetical protein